MRLWILALSICAVAAIGASATLSSAEGGRHGGPAASKRVVFPSNCGEGKFKPGTIILACADAGLYVQHIHWSVWNQNRAKGNGTAFAKSCKPDCVRGKIKNRGKARLRLRRVRTCPKTERPQFTRLTMFWNGRPSPYRAKYPPCGF